MSATARPIDEWERVRWNAWGHEGGFRLDAHNPDVVIHPQGDVIPGVMPYLKGVMNLSEVVDTPTLPKAAVLERLPAPLLTPGFMAACKAALGPDQVSVDPDNRLCHSVGKNYRDLWRMRNGLVEKVPDAVLLPACHRDVEIIMTAAVKHNVCLIPFGGGTNVVGAVEADPHETRRMIASVDMRRMRRLISVDMHAGTAVFEVGVLGPALEAQLAPHGLTMGHDPDSFVHSTLGGWIASRSSGAMSNKYGDLEDMVLSLRVVTPTGTVLTPTTARAVGPDLAEVFLGSEGALGIITEATVRVHRRPPCRVTIGWLFPSFRASCAAAHQMVKEDCLPTVLRCYDSAETEFSVAMKPQEGMPGWLLSKAVKRYLSCFKRFNLSDVSLVITGYDGDAEAVEQQRARAKGICRRHYAFEVGKSAGENWQRKKYDLPLVRDFLLDHGMWADVLETTVGYTTLIALWEDVRASMKRAAEALGRSLWIGAHVSHQYPSGVCLYFTFGSVQRGLEDLNDFLALKQAATEAILRNGGTLSHHHGIGYEHVPWMERYHGKEGLNVLRGLKKTLDPQGICNPGKLLPPEDDGSGDPKDRMMFFRMGTVPPSKL